MSDVFRFTFEGGVRFADLHDAIRVALVAAEGVHGQAQVRLEMGYWIDESRRTCIIDASAEAGQTVARIFTSLVSRQFGEDAFHVERVVDAGGGAAPGLPEGKVVFDARKVPSGAH